MKCREFREKMVDFICEKNSTNSFRIHIEECSNCKIEYKKYQEITSIVQMTRINPSKNFAKNLQKILHNDNTSFVEKLTFVVEYTFYRLTHTPLRVAWMIFLIVTTVSLPIWYFNYIEKHMQAEQQALPLWKIPAQTMMNN
ncbi:hypothetical protein [Candidatus Uabimicrobium sp. HlEnr_7]|uniref:hypothetical protein n=1 Tax=Candidatus Uabimicrobium helgolandensis TaxID=3095367 RepID=UPI003557E40C